MQHFNGNKNCLLFMFTPFMIDCKINLNFLSTAIFSRNITKLFHKLNISEKIRPETLSIIHS